MWMVAGFWAERVVAWAAHGAGLDSEGQIRLMGEPWRIRPILLRKRQMISPTAR